MKQDRRSPALRSLGVRTWRGAAIFGVQSLAILLPVPIIMKVVGGMLGIRAIVELSWWSILVSPIASAFGLFVAVAIYTEFQNLLNKLD